MMDDWQLAITPTDTVWGLVAKLNQKNIERIYQIKGRDKSKPLIIFAQTIEQLKSISDGWDPYIEGILRQYWPGALTLILPRSNNLADWINPGHHTIGMRIANSPSINKLLKNTIDGLLISTSANLSAEAPVSDYQEALKIFNDKVDLIIDSDEPCANQASTIIEYTNTRIKVLRQGSIVL
jgi:L-threonylcarbamoyladenylate synthase